MESLRTLTGSKPHDQSTADRPFRIYAALTDHCNRECPWCSACSSPRGKTWMKIEDLFAALPDSGPFEVQLEGGEPTIHPKFSEYVQLAVDHPRCEKLIVVTNGTAIPRKVARMDRWLERLGEVLTIKLSINHYLFDHDKGLINLGRQLKDRIAALGGQRRLVLNVRLRKGIEDDDRRVLQAVEDAGLLPEANVFFLQRYGFASDEESWELPFAVDQNFTLLNADGRAYGTDILTRSEAQRKMAQEADRAGGSR